RNARAEARIEPARWLAVEVHVPEAIGPVFESLRTGVERLARARPLERQLTREALEAVDRGHGLAVLVGDLEAFVALGPPDGGSGEGSSSGSIAGSADRERARLARELDDARRMLAAARARLADEAFMAKAPPAIVAGAESRATDLEAQVARLEGRLGGQLEGRLG
ncbi:MAG: hypothetical protein ACYDCI_15260, partial [Candidatus Limnocylindrales bacterium]